MLDAKPWDCLGPCLRIRRQRMMRKKYRWNGHSSWRQMIRMAGRRNRSVFFVFSMTSGIIWSWRNNGIVIGNRKKWRDGFSDKKPCWKYCSVPFHYCQQNSIDDRLSRIITRQVTITTLYIIRITEMKFLFRTFHKDLPWKIIILREFISIDHSYK